ncbi:MAG: SMC-Scp complex subunit ScpB [Clostridia bacterium]|nr:SMC-Scp complex subunit ScpB [Clostridia bacterium]MDO5302947.1 SMC-Scp complex subunit ScpB [Clostridia bacterium]
MNSKKTIKSAFESMMYIWGEPLEVKAAADIFNISVEDAEEYFLELQREYEQEGRGIVIRQVNKSFQFVTRPENAEFIERLCTPVKIKKLSQSALEVLAIIAYKQPITKGEIEAIRGVKSDRVIEGLTKKDLIMVKGKSNGIGRPLLYGTTENFLKQFGFTTLKELPDIDDIESAINVEVSDEIIYDDVEKSQISIDEVEYETREDESGEDSKSEE